MSDVDLIRETLEVAADGWLSDHTGLLSPGQVDCGACGIIDDRLEAHGPDCPYRRAVEALALLDGVTGLAREGDVVLSAEQASDLSVLLRWSRDVAPTNEHWVAHFTRALALLASGRPGEEQA